jgi:putative phosphoesterase
VSDSHGKANLLKKIVQKVKADHVIHCGDFCTSIDQLPDVSMTVVQGNCDWENAPKESVWEAGRLRFYVTHGHRYQVKTSLLPIRYRAEEVDAHVACFGHSHFPVCEQANGRLFINPGSIAYPRGFRVPSYAVLQTDGAGTVHVKYYTPDGKVIAERGGSFVLF